MDAQKTGKLINYLRSKKGLTQKQLAEQVNVSDKAVSKWERGDGCPDVGLLPTGEKGFNGRRNESHARKNGERFR